MRVCRTQLDQPRHRNTIPHLAESCLVVLFVAGRIAEFTAV